LFGPIWAIPFVGLLLSIAFLPVFAAGFWHRYFALIALLWCGAVLFPLFLLRPMTLAGPALAETLLAEYLPFVILLGTLFIVAGGIRLTGRIGGTALSNTGLIAFGTAIASLIGTTGAAVLLIRPLVRANQHRQHATHIFVFFIFLVANIGGALTPLGDPPLFLGFLSGVDFFWFARSLSPLMGLLAILLLALLYALERFVFLPREQPRPVAPPGDRITIQGSVNLLLLLIVLGLVLMSGVWRPGIDIPIAGVTIGLQNLLRDIGLVVIALASLSLTSPDNRRLNGFSWFPIVEVVVLFLAIFITMVPLIAMLHAGSDGPLASLMALTQGKAGPEPWRFFWMVGGLSSVLDNAPTFLVFWHVAGGDAATLTTRDAALLQAIASGAVFFGALSYIGNAPNFLVRSIVEQQGLKMPSFLGYVGWSTVVLLPCFALVGWVFLLTP
jgi:Na+/H+ antiporter NhaD/arsenite permease-like protein